MNDKIFSISTAEYPSGNSNLDGLSLDIFFIGCSRSKGHCPKCHNSSLWEFKEPNKSLNELFKTIGKAKKAKVITLLGGDPIDSMGEELTIKLLLAIKDNFNVMTCIYTYREFEEVSEAILEHLDYIKTGFYDVKRKTPTGSFLASKNQVMWKKFNNQWIKQWKFNGSNTNVKSV